MAVVAITPASMRYTCPFTRGGECSGSKCPTFLCLDECALWDELGDVCRTELERPQYATIHHWKDDAGVEHIDIYVVHATSKDHAKDITLQHQNADTPHHADAAWVSYLGDGVEVAKLTAWQITRVAEVMRT